MVRYYGPCRGGAAGAAFFYFVVWVISIISTSIPDWWWFLDSTSGVHEGLWSTCWAHTCVPVNQYDQGCTAMLNVVRAFSGMTILFGFFAFVDCLMLFYGITKYFLWGLTCGFLTVCPLCLFCLRDNLDILSILDRGFTPKLGCI